MEKQVRIYMDWDNEKIRRIVRTYKRVVAKGDKEQGFQDGGYFSTSSKRKRMLNNNLNLTLTLIGAKILTFTTFLTCLSGTTKLQ